MSRHCPYCGFNNPPDVGDCLYSRRNMPSTVTEVKEKIGTLKDIAAGDITGAGMRIGGDIITGQVSSIKYRFHPIWFLKPKLHQLEKSFITFLWIIGIIALLVVMGIIYNALGGKL